MSGECKLCAILSLCSVANFRFVSLPFRIRKNSVSLGETNLSLYSLFRFAYFRLGGS